MRFCAGASRPGGRANALAGGAGRDDRLNPMTNQSNKRSHTGRRIYVTVFRGIAEVDWSTVPDDVEVEIIDRDALEEPETAARLSGAARQYAKRHGYL